MFWLALLLAQAGATTPQIDRGEALFLDSARGCANCHALKGRGTAVGPNLKNMGSLPPSAIVMAVRSTVTQYVVVAKPKSGDAFPAMPGVKDGNSIQLFDLSKMPPEPRKMDKADVELASNDRWKHPPAVNKYTNEQMADIIAFIRYSVTGSKAKVDPSDVQ